VPQPRHNGYRFFNPAASIARIRNRAAGSRVLSAMSLWRLSGRKPREPRRRLNKPGWISAEGTFAVQRCTVENISDHGAQLSAADPKAIPKSFILSFAQGERRGKRCQVIWCRGPRLGVRFEE
jgi:hypothetical protein